MINGLVIEEMGSFENLNAFVKYNVRKVLVTCQDKAMSEFTKLFKMLPTAQHEADSTTSQIGASVSSVSVPDEHSPLKLATTILI